MRGTRRKEREGERARDWGEEEARAGRDGEKGGGGGCMESRGSGKECVVSDAHPSVSSPPGARPPPRTPCPSPAALQSRPRGAARAPPPPSPSPPSAPSAPPLGRR
eukprot:scaffold167562_cov33-Tisochrysis_lutea.AAC.1